MRVRTSEASLSPSPAEPAPSPAAPRAPARPEAPTFREVIGRLGQRIDQGERTVKGALAGTSTSDPAALIALQAGMYRYVEAVDLAAKLVDKASSGVKTVIQGQ